LGPVAVQWTQCEGGAGDGQPAQLHVRSPIWHAV